MRLTIPLRGRCSANNAQIGDAPMYSATCDAAVSFNPHVNVTVYTARLNPPRSQSAPRWARVSG